MSDHWELLDVAKALLALLAGMLLGLERELKNKAAGLKTITIICLGATLFSIISFKVGGTEDTRIAAYIVGGVGFIGAGVIFKDGITISGLTTAGIVWFSAAIGTSIGFGEFFLAATFLVVALLLIFLGSYIDNLFRNKKQQRQVRFEINKRDMAAKETILAEMREQGISVKENIIEVKNDMIKVIAEIVASDSKIAWLQEHFLHHALIHSFTI